MKTYTERAITLEIYAISACRICNPAPAMNETTLRFGKTGETLILHIEQPAIKMSSLLSLRHVH